MSSTQGVKILSQFSKSIGKLEFLIQNLENNIGQVARVPSPLISQYGLSNDQIKETIAQQCQQKTENENIKFFNSEKEEKLRLQQEKEQQLLNNEQNKKEAEGEKKSAQQQQKQKKENNKKSSKKPEQPKKDPTPEDLFYQIDIRVGNIVEVAKHPESEKLYVEKINIGDEVRNIASGLQQFVPIENMTGLCLVVTNLKPMKMAGFESNGMVLCSSSGDTDARQVELLRPPQGSIVGERVMLQGVEPESTEKPALLNPKKKVLQNALPFFKTNNELFATYNDHKWIVSSGEIKTDTIKGGTIG